MANYRQIHVSIWKDSWFLDLEPDEKLLFIYLFSNESTSLSGIYRVSKKVIAFETGLKSQRIDEILNKFNAAGKVYFENDIIWVVHMRKFHETRSTKVQTRIESDLSDIPDCQLKRDYIAHFDAENTLSIPYRYHIDTLPRVADKDKEENKDKEEDKEAEEEDNTAAAAIAEISKIYESEIGVITPFVRDKLVDAIDHYPRDWITEAIKEAVKSNVRKWSYVSAILQSWKTKGYKTEKAKTDAIDEFRKLYEEQKKSSLEDKEQNVSKLNFSRSDWH